MVVRAQKRQPSHARAPAGPTVLADAVLLLQLRQRSAVRSARHVQNLTDQRDPKKSRYRSTSAAARITSEIAVLVRRLISLCACCKENDIGIRRCEYACRNLALVCVLATFPTRYLSRRNHPRGIGLPASELSGERYARLVGLSPECLSA